MCIRDRVEGECFDVIVSNPPYVTEIEKRDMEPNVLNWEPSRALFEMCIRDRR